MKDLLLFRPWSLLFQAAAMALAYWLGDIAGVLVLAMLASALLVLSDAFQNRTLVAHSIAAFACLAVAAAVAPVAIVVVPFCWVLMYSPLRILHSRSFAASFLGLAMPLWLFLPIGLYAAWKWDLLSVASVHYAQAANAFMVLAIDDVTAELLVIYLVIVFVTLLLQVTYIAVHKTVRKHSRVQSHAYIFMVWAMLGLTMLLPASAPWLLPFAVSCLGPVVSFRLTSEKRQFD